MSYYFEDFNVGEKITTRARTVTEADIVMFASLSGDWHPLHVDAEYAKRGPFGERIAHGFLVLSIASGLLPFQQMAVIAFYGMDRVRFLLPTRIGDTITTSLEVIEKQESADDKGVVSFRWSVINQREEEVAVSIMKVLLSKKKA